MNRKSFLKKLGIKDTNEGDWLYYSNPPNIKGLDCVVRITKIYETSDLGRFRCQDGDNEKNWYELSRCRHATEKEIKAHLRKIADEKYLGRKVRCLKADDYQYKAMQEQTVLRFYEYCPVSDKLFYIDDQRWILLYEKGKWAEIVNEKKKLPKTKKQLQQMFNDYDEWLHNNPRQFTPIWEFLGDYED
jgi:hypothetical protein